MKSTIFYFSATGNSLQVARNLANKLENCELISIAKVVNQERINSESDRIGLVFPVFAWGMPRIVIDFMNKLSLGEKQYIFAVATCVAIPGNTLKDLQLVLRKKGYHLNAGFTVKSGRSSLMQLNTLDKIIISLDRRREFIKRSEERIDEIENAIKNHVENKPETSSWVANIFGAIFHNLALKSFKTIDSQFIVNDSCKKCGNCAKVCPRSNIVIDETTGPTFTNNCELCHACIQWCPNFAIKHPNFDITLKQYHNPEIKLKDIVAC